MKKINNEKTLHCNKFNFINLLHKSDLIHCIVIRNVVIFVLNVFYQKNYLNVYV